MGQVLWQALPPSQTLLLRENGTVKVNWERLLVGVVVLGASLAMIAADAQGYINIGKFGYAGVASWITLVVNFYFRKSPKA